MGFDCVDGNEGFEGRTKNKFYRVAQLFYDGGTYHIETSLLICRANGDLRHERVKL